MKPNKIEINVTKNMENTEFRHNTTGFSHQNLRKIKKFVPKLTEIYVFRHNTTGFSHQNLRNTKKLVPKLTENCEFRHKMTAPPKKPETIVTPITKTCLETELLKRIILINIVVII